MMSKKDNTELIKQLKKQLAWYSFEAEDTEFDYEKVNAIVRLLDLLDPLDDNEAVDVDEAFERFKTKYIDGNVEMSEELFPPLPERKIAKKRSGRVFKYILSSVATICVLIGAANVLTYATTKQSFFEVFDNFLGNIGIHVNTIPQEIEWNLDEDDIYTNWEEALKSSDLKILVPIYMSENLKLVKINVMNYEDSKFLDASYTDSDNNEYLQINIESWKIQNSGSQRSQFEDLGIVPEKKTMGEYVVNVDEFDGDMRAVFLNDNYQYTLLSNMEIEEIEKIILNMK